MEQWQDAASRQVEVVMARLAELLSRGQLWLRTELGVDLGLNSELISPWLILLAACSGLLLLMALWASLCRAVFKKQPVVQAAEDSGAEEVKRAENIIKEEPKKKKKKSEKKSQLNGRAVVEPQEEAMETEEIVPHHHQPPAEMKGEKAAEAKKSKKKAKQVAKESAKIVTTDSKEPEEGTWETKVSNKEKREQRKKDKGSSDGSSSPGGCDTPVTTTSEQPKGSPAAPPANSKKKAGDKVKPENVETVVPKGRVKTEPAAAPVLMAEVAKAPPLARAPKSVNWATNREPTSLWGSEIDGSWTVIDGSSLGTFPGLGVPAAEPKSVSELRWLSQPTVDDEWSGINGGPIDCNSDWNAPSELWGNYEEPAPDVEQVNDPLEPDKNSLLTEAADDDNEKDKDDFSGDGATKSKKKKKKKKAAQEGALDEQGEEREKETPLSSVKKQPRLHDISASIQTVKRATSEGKAERTMKENTVQKQPVTQVPQKPVDGEPTANSNSSAPTQQKKPEETQALKPAKKKRARRET